MTALVLVINSGSSSLKYQVIDPASGQVAAKGLIERVSDHHVAVREALAAIQAQLPSFTAADLAAIGHRVVHGGSRFSDPVLITDEVVAAVRELIPLAPLHNPANLAGIEATTAAFPGVPAVAVFDTAFHQSMPAAAYTYAVPQRWRSEYGVRRYGFHGTSVDYVTARVAELLERQRAELNAIVLHLGNGSSATAVRAGRGVDTSMGLSPLQGLVMGTRAGDVDPVLAAYLNRVADIGVQEFDQALNKHSGLLGLSGVSDFRELTARRDAGDADAVLAYDVMLHRLVSYVGAYAVQLGRVDAIVFTAGIGEHAPGLRADVAQRLGILGVSLDREANAAASGECRVSASASAIAVWVVPTNEELQIARAAAAMTDGRV